MSIFTKLKKGVALMAMAWEEQELDEALVLRLVGEHKASKTRDWMLTGERYYCVENDLLTQSTGHKEAYQADHKLVHATYKNIVDEKIAYLLSKEPSVKGESDQGTQAIIDALGDDFHYHLESLGFEATNKGIAWLHPYINEAGVLQFFVAPSEQIIPGWRDAGHTGLSYLIRHYTSEVYRFGQKKTIEHVEVWTAETVDYYRIEGSVLVRESEIRSHFKANNQEAAWGTVPWVPFKNNRKELPDIRFVKSLIDAYDLSRSEISNYIQEVKNLILILRGYHGDSVDELLQEIYQKRAVALDDDESAGITALTPTMDIEAARTHYEQLKTDILESGQSVNRNLDRFGSAPSGIALAFLYSGLELKGDQMQSEFRRGFALACDFVYRYLELQARGVKRERVEITFNRDMTINETEIIENCGKSAGLVSKDTILANHPWVSNINLEKEKLEKEVQASGTAFNRVPQEVDDDGEDE